MSRKRHTMLGRASLLLVAGLTLALGGCSTLVQHASARRVPFSYFGQVSVGVPVVEQRTVVVPLSFSGGDYMMNSGIAPHRIKTHVSGSEIDMTVMVALVGDGSMSKCQFVLSDVSPGAYTVFYRDPDGTRHRVGQVVIPKP